MSKPTGTTSFSEAGIGPLRLSGAIARAREEVARLSHAPVDAVTRSERLEDGGWLIVLDLLESPARLGDNDLLTTYEVALDAAGDPVRMERIARYKREERA